MRNALLLVVAVTLGVGCATYQPVLCLDGQSLTIVVSGRLEWPPLFVSSEPGVRFKVQVQPARYADQTRRFVVFNETGTSRSLLVNNVKQQLWLIRRESVQQMTKESLMTWLASRPDDGQGCIETKIGSQKVVISRAKAVLFILSVEDVRCLAFENPHDALDALQGDAEAIARSRVKTVAKFAKTRRENRVAWPQTIEVHTVPGDGITAGNSP